MAWTDQCKLEACNQLDHRMQSGMTKREALKALSKESEIPVGTLNRWKYGKRDGFKNEPRKNALSEDSVFKSACKRMERMIDFIDENHPGDDRTKMIFNFKLAACLTLTFIQKSKEMGYSKVEYAELYREASQSLVADHIPEE